MVPPSLRVLVVDDDAGIREMLALVLGEAGHDVVTSDGSAPIDATGVDVALVDVLLQNRTARDLLAESPGLAGLPLVLMTAYDLFGDLAPGLPDGTVLLRKPFDIDDLERTVGEALSLAKRAEGMPAMGGVGHSD